MKSLTINLTNREVPKKGGSDGVMATEDLGGIISLVVGRLKSLLDEIHAKHNIQTFASVDLYVSMNIISMAAISFLQAALPIAPNIYMQTGEGFQYLGLWSFEVEGADWKQNFNKKEVVSVKQESNEA